MTELQKLSKWKMESGISLLCTQKFYDFPSPIWIS